MSYNELLLDLPMDHMENIFGQFDANIKLIESTLHVSFVARGDNIKILGDEESGIVITKPEVVNDLACQVLERVNPSQHLEEEG